MAQNNQKTRPVDIHGKSFSRFAMMALILSATFAGVLMQTSLGTALPTLMESFDINLATAQQATTWFLLANGIMIPVSAYLTTKFPTRWLYLAAFALIILGMGVSVLTPPQPDMWNMFLVGRILAALGVGITMPLMQVVMVNIFPAEERGAAMGLGGLVVGMGPAIGPVLSGWILESPHTVFGMTIEDTWQSIFYFPMVVLSIAFVLGFFLLKDVVPNKKIQLDMLSLIESIIGFGLFLWGFTNVAAFGWFDMTNVILPIVFGVLIIAIFIRRQLHLAEPFLNVRVFQNKQFALTTLAIMMAMMAMMGVEMMLPTYLQNIHGMNAFRSGLVLLPGALVMGMMSPIAGRVYDRIGARRLAAVGFSILAIGTLPFVFLTVEAPEAYITALYALRMFGIAMVMMPLTASAMGALPPEQASHATASNNTARQVSSAVVVALLTSVTQNVIDTNKPTEALRAADPIKYASDFLNASMDGFRISFTLSLVFALVGIVVAYFLHTGKTGQKKAGVK